MSEASFTPRPRLVLTASQYVSRPRFLSQRFWHGVITRQTQLSQSTSSKGTWPGSSYMEYGLPCPRISICSVPRPFLCRSRKWHLSISPHMGAYISLMHPLRSPERYILMVGAFALVQAVVRYSGIAALGSPGCTGDRALTAVLVSCFMFLIIRAWW